MIKKLFSILFVLFVLVGTAHGGSQTASATLASAIIVNAREYLQEPTASPVTWNDTQLLVWLNDGQVDIAVRGRPLSSSVSVSLTADTYEYSVTGNWFGITDVVYINSDSIRKGLIRSDPASVGHENSVAEPAFYYEYADSVGVFPTLSSVTTETVVVYRTMRPTDVAAGAAVEVPLGYDRALTYYIVGQAQAKDQQFAKSKFYMDQYHAELDRLRFDYNEQIKKSRESVRP
ncbi:MAG: hypothetical protein V3S89_06150 [Desulfobacterales bacterium]